MQDIQTVIDELVSLGEDRDEMEFWGSMYPNLSPNDQKLLLDNLTRELEELRKRTDSSMTVGSSDVDEVA